MAQSKINNRVNRIVLYGCLVLVIILVAVVVSIIAYFVIPEKKLNAKFSPFTTASLPIRTAASFSRRQILVQVTR